MRQYLAVVVPADRGKLMTAFLTALAGPARASYEVRIESMTGRRRRIRGHFEGLVGPEGDIVAVVGSIRDAVSRGIDE